MVNQSPLPKTSGRRRHGRNGNGNGTPQKTYASENDAASYQQHYLSDTPNFTPHTPQKGTPGTQTTAHHQHAQSTNQKQRNKNSSVRKPRNKNDRQSPPSAAQISESLAFAGASWAASPAPGSLPMPSFLAKATSAPDSPNMKSPQSAPTQELSPPTTDSEENGSPPPIVPRNEESPLEFFFKADRAEKAKTRRASSANVLGPFSPPHDSRSPQECSTFPRTAGALPIRRPHLPRQPSSGIPSSELDGNPGKPFGQAFSTPYAERIRAARSNQGSAQATPSASRSGHLDQSEAMKRYLFGGQNPAKQHNLPTTAQQNISPQASHHQLPRGMFPASMLSGGHPAYPQVQQANATMAADPQSEQMRKMEDTLRQVLKLGPSA
ncbi:hypothetical protein BX600DRAFT_515891 [Xylariales sp. PMI_506]|nr:hypothetical protein BX600DRAFT_515891 [Xylariales sp. PMI_506]